MKDLQNFAHQLSSKTGVLLVNLGTPEAPDRAAVRRYLKQFLWDRRVVELPRWLWWPVLNLIILNTRPARSAKAYQKVWTDQGSPLMLTARAQTTALRAQLATRFDGQVLTELAMCYGSLDIPTSLSRLHDAGARRILILPLYPQYSATTVGSVFDAVTATLRQWRWLPELRFINHYHDEPGYIAALADSVRTYRAQHGSADKLVMSFHGIPQDYFHQGDPYHCECQKTGRLLAEALELTEDDWTLTFQSRLGPKKWLQPYTDQTLQQLGADRVRSVQVICPGFSADCLETLEEIAQENRDIFIQAGGEQFQYIPCLNDTTEHIDVLADLVSRHLQGWI
ncbi:MAG: ferrochelatase [Pseudomonadota bacterium]